VAYVKRGPRRPWGGEKKVRWLRKKKGGGGGGDLAQQIRGKVKAFAPKKKKEKFLLGKGNVPKGKVLEKKVCFKVWVGPEEKKKSPVPPPGKKKRVGRPQPKKAAAHKKKKRRQSPSAGRASGRGERGGTVLTRKGKGSKGLMFEGRKGEPSCTRKKGRGKKGGRIYRGRKSAE